MNRKLSLTYQLLIESLIGVIVFFILSFIGLTSYSPEVTAVGWFFFLTIVLFSCSAAVIQGTNERIVFWMSYIVKLAYMAFSLRGQDYTNPVLGTDAFGFWRVASQYYEGIFYTKYTAFPYVINAEFHIFGKNIACCLLTNIFFSMIMLLFVFLLLNKFKIIGNIRFFVDCIACFLPYSIIVNASLLREPIYFALISISFYEFVLYLETKNTRYLYFAVCLMLPVLILHIGYFPIPLIYFCISMKISNINTKKGLLISILQMFVLIIFIISVMNIGSTGYIIRGDTFAAEYVFNRISGEFHYKDTLDAGSAYLLNLQAHSWGDAILYTPIRAFYYLFSPLPTNWRGITDIAAFILDSCIHFYVLINALIYVRQIKRAKRDRDKVTLEETNVKNYLVRMGLWQILLCAVIFGLGTATAGTAIRHRDVLLPIEALVLAVCLQNKKERAIRKA